ncbi:hypothetical protein HW130_31220 [Streptomyces sp. PKU-EA00015]|uniref:hypothetical protein n=1 Tax=Streptomyces sp. PKU-EA00015 TaxID=2748326 RepID=UPI0015A1953B|nr:hypothetical protein [Streptomyces sp. PKU-EA00015]NWF30670.1 hypothetical protein [Streptomyces sp. PKU-EA00015]
MRQLSAPGRTAVWIAASLAAMACAGCMSVREDEGRKPAPSTSSEGRGAEPDGGHGAPGGAQRPVGHGEEDRERKHATADDEAGKGRDAEGSPSPSGAASGEAEPTPGGKPAKPGAKPTPPHGGGSPPPPQQLPSLPPPQSPTPPASPTPQPSEPTDQPPASSAPEVHAGATRSVEHPGSHRGGDEPAASPQARLA